MRKLLLACSAFLLGLSEANAQEVKLTGYEAFYGTYINYSGSDVKDKGESATGYLALTMGQDTLQLGISLTRISYKNDQPDLDQQDFTVAYTNTNGFLRNHTFTFGLHYINSDDDLTDGGFTLFFDGTYSSYQKTYPYLFNWSGGIGFYYTSYSNTVDFNVFQVTPHATFRLFSDYKRGALYTDVTGYGIYVENKSKVGLGDSNYYSLDVALRYYYGGLDVKFGGWAGEQVFAVKNSGFVVYNLKEKYKGGVYGELGYTFRNGLRVSLNLSINRYKEVDTGESVTQTVGTLSVGYRF
ncbi:hypothetical protein [Phorcysia thermohydrogeniphila]|uniref:Outer membrane protein with beta-barrel domain n=1 Tax=Phorcysia thermohydrogeniphila TaxID=936138 RepID=A0A4R1GDX0_9BACT|nr:hypothetical protein [Phorcysia thermohydrogeniphila]TCK06324.1 hypothetical protein CLV27_0125 [Phorcysia thermohydrogeniphila]